MSNFYDAVIIGGGPAGLTAAIYLARAGMRTLVLEKGQPGGQLADSFEVANYPGVISVPGREIGETMLRQAESFGAEIRHENAVKLRLRKGDKTVLTDSGEYSCRGVLIAAGARPKSAGFPGEEEFRGRGVSYCAVCDGEFFTGQEIFVVGGGFSAAEESVYLARYASRVTVVIRGEGFKCAPSAAKAALSHPKITVLTRTEIVRAAGDDKLRSVTLRNKDSGEETTISPENGLGIFVYVGYEPESGFLKGQVDMDERGCIITDSGLQTSVSGVFAAGDIRQKTLRQAATAVGDGALAAAELEKYISAVRQDQRNPSGERTAQYDNGMVRRAEQSSRSPQSSVDTEFPPELSEALSRARSPLTLEINPDGRAVSQKLKEFAGALARISGNISVRVAENPSGQCLPCVRVTGEGGCFTFHGVPAGHELLTFAESLQIASGAGEAVSQETAERLAAIKSPVMIQVLVTASCSRCPELVLAAITAACINPLISADIYDVLLFPALREKYGVMSVPFLIINGEKAGAGRKSLAELTELITRSISGTA